MKNIFKLLNRNQYDKKSRLVTFLNPYSYLLARQNKELFGKFDLYVDGILLVMILKLVGKKNILRESFDMTSVAPIVFNKAIQKNQSLYFIGAKPDIINKAIENIQREFQALQISGFRDGYVAADERNKVLENIKDLNPDIVVCGMGTPLQELFLADLRAIGWDGLGYTCGGFLHQTAENIEYYPKWIDKYNFRWAYRLYDEPKLFKRYFWEYPKFLFYFTCDFMMWKLMPCRTDD